MRIGILGTRGIPNHYSGYEQFAEYFSQFMLKKGHDIYVYSSSLHPYQEDNYKGVELIRQKDPEDKLGSFGQFIYDWNCIKDSRNRNFDLLLLLGYTSSSIWGWYLPKKTIIVSNMDGLEWKRTKYNWAVRQFLKFAEYLAIKTSDYYISDSLGIQTYLHKKYGIVSEYIAYGVHTTQEMNPNLFKKLNLETNNYNMLIARMEPENNIETVLDGVVKSQLEQKFIVIGNAKNKFGLKLQKKFEKYPFIKFIGPVYELSSLNYLRENARLYFHGHSVGGTNPSLLEAMASNARICAHNNPFNRSILEEDAFYFQDSDEIALFIKSELTEECEKKKERNRQKVLTKFSWDTINSSYESFFKSCLPS
jgi:glycosyltransferase involved in cell wall biosynthesis